MAQVKIKIYGEVQGVGFRWALRREAARLGFTATAENLVDGSVEIVAQGEEDALEQLLAFAKTGPSSARVERVETEWS